MKITKYLPISLVKKYRRMRGVIEKNRSKGLTTEEVFTSIYKEKKWGGDASDEESEFNSGSGSTTKRITEPYVELLTRWLDENVSNVSTLVDLGCGDFRVGRELVSHCRRYIGIDIVEPLIDHHNRNFSSSTVGFKHLNIVTDELPDGDVACIRQVMQHLSNDQVQSVLCKLTKYKHVFITEHHPDDSKFLVANLDKVHGGDTRVEQGSGIYITDAPFNISQHKVNMVLDVPAADEVGNKNPGRIRTFLVTNSPE